MVGGSFWYRETWSQRLRQRRIVSKLISRVSCIEGWWILWYLRRYQELDTRFELVKHVDMGSFWIVREWPVQPRINLRAQPPVCACVRVLVRASAKPSSRSAARAPIQGNLEIQQTCIQILERQTIVELCHKAMPERDRGSTTVRFFSSMSAAQQSLFEVG